MVTTKLGLCVMSKPGFRASHTQEVAHRVGKMKHGAENSSVLI